MPTRCEICCEIMIAILLPPIGVCFRHGCCSVCILSSSLCLDLSLSLSARSKTVISFLQVEFIICLLLTILGYIPGIIYALYAIIFVDRDQYFDEYRRPLYSQY
ncbi:Proteolipid membrane potential modulator [Vigna unguiculata]|uniref:Proteolipid membrane potential modulator n=1 Tax=Vigna unguiculata TaxID=3917 RepID=A0A4D6KVT3_VIGUN|nr:Proteolipid membrane potential modulator [Vigna unguiculata]